MHVRSSFPIMTWRTRLDILMGADGVRYCILPVVMGDAGAAIGMEARIHHVYTVAHISDCDRLHAMLHILLYMHNMVMFVSAMFDISALVELLQSESVSVSHMPFYNVRSLSQNLVDHEMQHLGDHHVTTKRMEKVLMTATLTGMYASVPRINHLALTRIDIEFELRVKQRDGPRNEVRSTLAKL